MADSVSCHVALPPFYCTNHDLITNSLSECTAIVGNKKMNFFRPLNDLVTHSNQEKTVPWMMGPFQFRDCYLSQLFHIITAIISQQRDSNYLQITPQKYQ